MMKIRNAWMEQWGLSCSRTHLIGWFGYCPMTWDWMFGIWIVRWEPNIEIISYSTSFVEQDNY